MARRSSRRPGPSRRTRRGRANPSMIVLKGPAASATGWVYDTIATSASQFTGCGTTRGCRWGDYSATQIDNTTSAAGGPRAWGFNQLETGTSQFNWGTKAALVE